MPASASRAARFSSIAGLFLAALVFGYVALRAGTLSLTPDEGLSYLVHARASLWSNFDFQGSLKSNNHLLNTLLLKLSTGLFGGSEFAIRIPALLGALAYIVYGYKLLRLLLPNVAFLAGLAVLSMNPYVVEFLSLSRGYSLGAGLLVAGLYYFVRWAQAPAAAGEWRLAVAFLWIALAVTACLPVLDAWVGALTVALAMAVAGLFEPASRWRMTWVVIRAAIPGGLMLLAIVPQQVMGIGAQGEFTSGPGESLYTRTVVSLVRASAYGSPYINGSLVRWIARLAVAMVSVSAFLVVWSLARRRSDELGRAGAVIAGTLVMSVACIWLQNVLLGVRFVSGRQALYLIPIFLLTLALLWGQLARLPRPRWLSVSMSGLALAVTAALVMHGLRSVNLTHTREWRANADAKEAMMIVALQFDPETQPPDSVSIAISWWLEPSVNYYRERLGIRWLRRARRGIPMDHRLLYMARGGMEERLDGSVHIIGAFTVSNTRVAVRDPRPGPPAVPAEPATQRPPGP